jgi:hypothetical protein
MNTIKILSKPLKTLLKAVALAAEDSTARYALDCVQLEVEPNTLRLIATDGKRMHVATETGCVPTDSPVVTVLLKPEIIKAILKGSSKGYVRIDARPYLEIDYIVVHVPKGRRGEEHNLFPQQRPEKRFPRWREVMPTDAPRGSASFDTTQFDHWYNCATETKPVFNVLEDGTTDFHWEVARYLQHDRLPKWQSVQGSLELSLNMDYLRDAMKITGPSKMAQVFQHSDRYCIVSGPMKAIIMAYYR